MINHPEVGRKQSSESVGLLGTKIVTELSELPKAVQEDGVSLKSEILEYTSQSDISNTQSVQGSEEPSLKKGLESEGKDSGEKDGTGKFSYTQVKTMSDVIIKDRILTREETFGAGSEKIEEVPGSVSLVSEESHTQEEKVVIEEANVEVQEGVDPSSPVVVMDERCLILKGYGRKYGSSESNYSKSSINTTRNLQLLRKSPFSTRNGSDISRASSVSKKEGGSEVLSSKGSDIVTEPDWKDIMSKSQSCETSMKGENPLESLKGRNDSGLGDSDTSRSQKEYQVAYREFSRGYKTKYAAKSSSESYKLIRRNAMELIDSPREDVSEEKRLVQRFLLDGEDERPLMCYQKIENRPVVSGDKAKEHGEGRKAKDESIKGHSGSKELKRDLSATTLADYDDCHKEDGKKKKNRTQNNIGVNLIVKRTPRSKRLSGGVKAMDKFNGFFSVMRAGMVKHTMVLATIFWLVSFWCLYPSMFTGWLKNEIKYRKGDIKGSSVTLIGLNRINRYDAAYLRDGALLTLSRKVTFEDVLNDEDPLDDFEEFTTTTTKLTPSKFTITTTIKAPTTVTETVKRGPEESSDKEDEYEARDDKSAKGKTSVRHERVFKEGTKTGFTETEAKASNESGKESLEESYKEDEAEPKPFKREGVSTGGRTSSTSSTDSTGADVGGDKDSSSIGSTSMGSSSSSKDEAGSGKVRGSSSDEATGSTGIAGASGSGKEKDAADKDKELPQDQKKEQKPAQEDKQQEQKPSTVEQDNQQEQKPATVEQDKQQGGKPPTQQQDKKRKVVKSHPKSKDSEDEEKYSTKNNIRGNSTLVERVNKSLDIYKHCPYERNFIKKSCCFRDMCEVGNLDDKDTKYFKSLYGATVYDIHYSEFKNLQKGGNIAMSTGMLSMFFSCLVLMITLSRLGAFPHPKLREAAFNLGIIAWVISIFLSLLGFLLWNHYTGGAVCVDEEGRSKPCSLHTGSILFILHIIFEGVGLILEIVNSVLLRPKEIVGNVAA
ncbi:hypothetical protein MACJ_002364 [Theileria orientalis]|uniref:Uncharacterized protein n=1 Tax=Theileria orientalis TaxID=68886 RepID=A0A976QQI5_THEOR|nr:hypothetical protein MACJ_002364 [Theileria orientalis]